MSIDIETIRPDFERKAITEGYCIERSKPADQMAGIDYQYDDTDHLWYGFKMGVAMAAAQQLTVEQAIEAVTN